MLYVSGLALAKVLGVDDHVGSTCWRCHQAGMGCDVEVMTRRTSYLCRLALFSCGIIVLALGRTHYTGIGLQVHVLARGAGYRLALHGLRVVPHFIRTTDPA